MKKNHVVSIAGAIFVIILSACGNESNNMRNGQFGNSYGMMNPYQNHIPQQVTLKNNVKTLIEQDTNKLVDSVTLSKINTHNLVSTIPAEKYNALVVFNSSPNTSDIGYYTVTVYQNGAISLEAKQQQNQNSNSLANSTGQVN